MKATFWWPKIMYGHAGFWAKGLNTVNILHDYILPWQEWVRLSLANQPADAPLSSSITTPTSSRFLPWIILSPNHGGAFELSYYHQTMLISFNYLCTKQAPIRPTSYHRPITALHLQSDLVNFLHSIHASILILSLSSHQGQMYEASVASPWDWPHFPPFICAYLHCCTV